MPDEIRILHVDDELDFADITATYLEREDDRFSVDTATSAADGLHQLDDSIDCVLSDYEMPGMNGIEFLTTIREEYPDIPFILYTGKGSEEVASDAISAGLTDYFQKQTGSEQYELLANRIVAAVGQYRAERELERQNDLFAKAQDLANVGAWEYNPQEEKTYFTDMVYEIYGVGPDHEPGPEKDIQKFYHPEDRDTVRKAVEEALESGTEYDIEVRITAADGTKKWVRTRGTPQVEDGTVQSVRGTIQDITERKERERELERQNERLDEFISVVSHDLKNPLNTLSLSLDLLETDDEDTLERCRRAVERMKRLIDDLLTLALHGETTAEEKQVSLEVVANECAQTTVQSQERVSVETDTRIVAEKARLKHLLENLFSNAIDHGGEDVSITVGRIDGGFYVEDDGVGIPEDERETCFDVRYSTSEQGTGFGLTIVKQVVAAHGWDIHVTESDDGGARFEITGVESVT